MWHISAWKVVSGDYFIQNIMTSSCNIWLALIENKQEDDFGLNGSKKKIWDLDRYFIASKVQQIDRYFESICFSRVFMKWVLGVNKCFCVKFK